MKEGGDTGPCVHKRGTGRANGPAGTTAFPCAAELHRRGGGRCPLQRLRFYGEGNRGGSPPLDTWLHLKLHIFLSLHFFPRESKHTGVTKHGLGAKPFCY